MHKTDLETVLKTGRQISETLKISRAFGAGTLPLRYLPPDRSLGRGRLWPDAFSQDAEGGERERPNTADSPQRRRGQSTRERPAPLQVPLLQQLRLFRGG